MPILIIPAHSSVIPAQAGIWSSWAQGGFHEIPAYAGMTEEITLQSCRGGDLP